MRFEIQFTIRRVLLGTFLASLPIAVFGRMGGGGVVVGSVIALSLLAICLIADRDRLDWALGVFIFAGTGFGVAALCPPVGRIEEMQDQFVAFTLTGAIVGYIVCECNLRRIQKLRRESTEENL